MVGKIFQREIIKGNDSYIRSTNKNLGTQMEDFSQYQYDKYHSHPDYQLMLLINGDLNVVISDQIVKFSVGDIILLGPDLPHFLVAGQSLGNGFLIQFPNDIFPSSIEMIPDYSHIYTLIKQCSGGLLFKSDFNEPYIDYFEKIHSSGGIDRMCLLLRLLNQLGMELHNGKVISYIKNDDINGGHQIDIATCKAYLRSHYLQSISLQQVAEAVHLNKTALCRAFRRETGETIFGYITRIRLEASFELLRNTKLGVGEIAYRCGFSSLPHFNKKFKLQTNVTPSQYRTSLLGI